MTEQKVNSLSAAKPYHSGLSAFWWLKHRYYLLYMLREATVLPLLFFLGCLMYGLYSLSQSEQHWLGFVAFMQQGWVIALNLLAFVASLFHAKTAVQCWRCVFCRVFTWADATFRRVVAAGFTRIFTAKLCQFAAVGCFWLRFARTGAGWGLYLPATVSCRTPYSPRYA